MAQAIPFLLVLSLALLAPSFSKRQYMLKGHWLNIVRPVLVIRTPDKQGRFNGTYVIDKPYPLKGIQRVQDGQISFEFTVNASPDRKIEFKGIENDWGREVLLTSWVDVSRVDNKWTPIRAGVYKFTRLCSCWENDTVGNFNADRSTQDVDRLSCTKTGQYSQEKFDSPGDFEADGSAWDTEPFSGSTTWS